MSISLNTNMAALNALNQLNQSNRDLESIQSRINTGRKVNSARDNGAVFGMAQTLRADIAGFRAVTNSLDHAISATNVAYTATDTLSDLMLEMKEKALAASEPSLDARSRAILNEDFIRLRDQIDGIVSNAQFNSVNLVDGTNPDISPLTDTNGGKAINVPGYDMKLGGADNAVTASTIIDPFANAEDALTKIETSLDNQNRALNVLGGKLRTMETTRTLVVKTSDILTKNLGTLVDADLGKESARLQAAQTKQQLQLQALNIANQLPTFATQLFNS